MIAMRCLLALIAALSLSRGTGYRVSFPSGIRRWTRSSTEIAMRKMMPSKPFAPEMVGQDIPLSDEVSELPNTFQDAVSRSVTRSLDCISTGQLRVRIDFDTTIGDMTYTSLKNTMPMIKEFTAVITREMDLTMTVNVPADSTETDANTDNAKTSPLVPDEPLRTMRIFFPDMGAAALARRDWKMGTDVAEVPPSVRTANMQNDVLEPTDKIAVILCPQSSEVDFVKRIMEMCDNANIPVVMVNPNLVNMDQGYGVRARNLRKDLLATFVTSYQLKTMKTGAVVREWPAGYSVWNEDATVPEGYTLLQTYAKEPPRELVDALYDIANPDPEKEKDKTPAIAKNIMGFFQGLSRL